MRDIEPHGGIHDLWCHPGRRTQPHEQAFNDRKQQTPNTYKARIHLHANPFVRFLLNDSGDVVGLLPPRETTNFNLVAKKNGEAARRTYGS